MNRESVLQKAGIYSPAVMNMSYDIQCVVSPCFLWAVRLRCLDCIWVVDVSMCPMV